MRKLYTFLVIIAILIIGYIFADWLRTFVITSLGGYTKKETVTKTETKYIKGKVDTLAVFNHYVETKGIILNPKPKIKYITKYDTIRDTIYKKKIKEFKVNVKDSLIDGEMTIRNYFNGDLFSADFKYKPLFPKYITRVDTIFKTETITETLTKERSKFGIGIGYDWEQTNAQLLGSYTLKNGIQLIYEYEFPLTKDIQFGLPNQKNQSVKLLYNF